MNIMIIGASKGLGRALVEGVGSAGDTVIGVSRQRPQDVQSLNSAAIAWIEADMSHPVQAVNTLAAAAPSTIDVLIYNLGIWEAQAFSDAYNFLNDSDDSLQQLVEVNITATLLALKRLMPNVLRSNKAQVILTGSTSALRQSGRPEVAFGASKFALSGMADALREGFRTQGLKVSVLQLGYLNTEDALSVPVVEAAVRDEGHTVPVHDVVSVVRTMLALSDASFIRELVLPARYDERF